ncbi:MAG: 6,7-dimethyl-8-ribityllumazine synthase [Opitutales bacterium]
MSDQAPSPRTIDGKGRRFAIVAARFNATLVDALLERARSTLESAGAAVDAVRVPGSGEVPFTLHALAGTGRYQAVIGLGVAIKGETDHHNHLAQATGYAMQRAAQETGIPVINGIIVTDSQAQAEARTTGGINRGEEFAQAALEMAALHASLQAGQIPGEG